MTNVLIVDDERMVQELFSHYIAGATDRYSLTAAIKGAANAELYCVHNRVGLILMDVCTADDESGIDAAAQIKKKYPAVKIIIVTSAPDYRFIDKARAAGADSFWYKEVGTDELLDIMDRTMAGEHIYPDTTPRIKVGLADSTEFTQKELEVLSYLVQGKSLTEIAELMGVDYTTTKTHIKHLKEKTGTTSVSRLAVLAARTKFILPEY